MLALKFIIYAATGVALILITDYALQEIKTFLEWREIHEAD